MKRAISPRIQNAGEISSSPSKSRRTRRLRLGAAAVTGSYPGAMDARRAGLGLQLMKIDRVKGNACYPIHTVDALYRNRTLAFAHFAAEHEAVLAFMKRARYELHRVDERCGWKDCRNHVGVPSELTDINRRLAAHAFVDATVRP